MSTKQDVKTEWTQGVTRRQFLRSGALATGGLFTAQLLGACATSTGQPSAPAVPVGTRGGGTLTVALPSEPVALDTAQVGETNTRRLMYQLYDPLVQEAPDGTKFVPGLAESWESSPDGLIHIFKLRRGVQFHDGTPFNAKAVKYNFDRQMDKSHPFYGMAPSWILSSAFLLQVTSMDVVDDYTFRINQKAPDPNLFPALSTTLARMASPTAIEKYGKSFTENPVGTGPFRFVSWEKGVRLVMERNPSHYVAPPSLEKMVFVPISEPQARVTALQTGQVDFLTDIPPDSVAILERDPNLTMWKGITRHFWALVLNQKNVEAFRDKRVRQAIAYAINKNAIVRDVLRDTATVADGPFSAAFAAYRNPNVRKYSYDVTRAKQLLAEAGYSNGFTLKFRIPSSGAGFLAPGTMAQLIQSNLAAVGVKAEIETMEIAAYNKMLLAGDFEMAPQALSTSLGTLDSVLYTYFHGQRHPPSGLSIGFWNNDEFDKTVDEARASPDDARRKQLFNRAQEIIAEDAPWVFICHEQGLFAMKKAVKGFSQWANYDMAFKEVSLG